MASSTPNSCRTTCQRHNTVQPSMNIPCSMLPRRPPITISRPAPPCTSEQAKGRLQCECGLFAQSWFARRLSGGAAHVLRKGRASSTRDLLTGRRTENGRARPPGSALRACAGEQRPVGSSAPALTPRSAVWVAQWCTIHSATWSYTTVQRDRMAAAHQKAAFPPGTEVMSP
jgi:hypothetical protein